MQCNVFLQGGFLLNVTIKSTSYVRWNWIHSNLARLSSCIFKCFLITSIVRLFSLLHRRNWHVKGGRHSSSSFLPGHLSTEPKRLFTSKIIQRAEISSASVSIVVPLLHVCPPTEPARLLGVWFPPPPLLFSRQHNACFLTLSVCARVWVRASIHRGIDTLGLFSLRARKQESRCFHVPSSLPWQWLWW